MKMTHPDSGPVRTVTRDAFDRLWAPKGWQEVPEDQTVSADGAATDGNAAVAPADAPAAAATVPTPAAAPRGRADRAVAATPDTPQ
jgi:hypothetical protein